MFGLTHFLPAQVASGANVLAKSRRGNLGNVRLQNRQIESELKIRQKERVPS